MVRNSNVTLESGEGSIQTLLSLPLSRSFSFSLIFRELSKTDFARGSSWLSFTSALAGTASLIRRGFRMFFFRECFLNAVINWLICLCMTI